MTKETSEESIFKGTCISEDIKNFHGYQLSKIMTANILGGAFNPIEKSM